MILSRRIAARNQYPAIDVLGSLSRVMSQIVPKEHQADAGRVRKLMAKYDELEPLIQMGEYKAGNDAFADEAVQRYQQIAGFLGQRTDDLWEFDRTLSGLSQVAGQT